MYKADYSKYFNPEQNKNRKKRILKETWKWTKIFFMIFLIVSVIWGCVQMFVSKYQTGQVTDMTGDSVYSPGVSFEIVIRSLNDYGYKTHWIIGSGTSLSEYDYFQISNWREAFTKTSSPYYGFFVYPIGYILVGFLRLFSGTNSAGGFMDDTKANYGVATLFAILITTLITRGITLMFTWRAQKNQERLQVVQAKQAEIQAKYAGRTDPTSKQRQQLETMELYRKEGISPMGSLVASFSSMPFLFAMYAIVRATHALKVAKIGQISLIEQPWGQVTSGHWIYFTLLAVYLPLQICSMMLPLFLQLAKQRGKILSPQQKKSRRRQIIMQSVFAIIFIFIVATVASGVAIYWIFSSSFQICQTLGFHYSKELKARRIKMKRNRAKNAAAKEPKKIAKKEKNPQSPTVN